MTGKAGSKAPLPVVEETLEDHEAVARINLDKAPSPATLDRLRAGNADIIELDLLTLQS